MIKGSAQMFCKTSIRRAVKIHYQRNTLKTTGHTHLDYLLATAVMGENRW